MGLAIVVGLLAFQVWITVALLDTDVDGAWVPWVQTALLLIVALEIVASWHFVRQERHEVAYAVTFGGVAVTLLLAVPLVFGW